MKKIILLLSSISLLTLGGCGLKTNPENIIKQTQANLINKITNTALSQKKGEFKGNLAIIGNTPLGSGIININFTGLTNNLTGLVNFSGNAKYNFQQENGTINTNGKFITTLKKIYFKINSLQVNTTNPTLQAYSSMAKMLIGKRFFLPLQNQSNYNLQKVNFKQVLSEYPIFKADETLGKNKFKVELNKDNIIKIIKNINKQLNQATNEDKIKESLKNINIEGILKIQQDKLHFSFSGYVENKQTEEKTFLTITYLPNTLQIDLPELQLNLDLKNDTYNGYLLLKLQQVKINLSGKLNTKEFEINANYNQEPINISAKYYYEINPKTNIKIKIPENAINMQELIQQFQK